MRKELPSVPSVDWWTLREIVMDAADYKALSLHAKSLRSHPVVQLVESYLTTGETRSLEEAARLVALAKPGVSRRVAEENYWLVLDKS